MASCLLATVQATQGNELGGAWDPFGAKDVAATLICDKQVRWSIYHSVQQCTDKLHNSIITATSTNTFMFNCVQLFSVYLARMLVIFIA